MSIETTIPSFSGLESRHPTSRTTPRYSRLNPNSLPFHLTAPAMKADNPLSNSLHNRPGRSAGDCQYLLQTRPKRRREVQAFESARRPFVICAREDSRKESFVATCLLKCVALNRD